MNERTNEWDRLRCPDTRGVDSERRYARDTASPYSQSVDCPSLLSLSLSFSHRVGSYLSCGTADKRIAAKDFLRRSLPTFFYQTYFARAHIHSHTFDALNEALLKVSQSVAIYYFSLIFTTAA